MKKRLLLVSLSLISVALASCGGTSSPVSEIISSFTPSIGSSIEAPSSSPSTAPSSSLASSSSSEASSSSSEAPKEDPTKYNSVDDETALTPSIDTTSTAGYGAGRNVFESFMKNSNSTSIIYKEPNGVTFLPNKGASKILVVPVLFSDTTKTAEDKDDFRKSCYKAFFGSNDNADTTDDVNWESVRSYYYKSSYHQLYLEGTVAPCFTLPKPFSKYAGSDTAINAMPEKVYNYLFTGTDPIYKVSDFDSNGDGVIDSIYMINEAPIDSSTDLGWAFTTHHHNLKNTYNQIGAFAWSSLDFAIKGGGTLEKPDSHTFIHESGHLLGLNDYYDPNNSSSCKAGGATMQDYNICDHESFSKYLWGWTSPQVVTDANTEDTIDIELKPFESTGDSLILTTRFNNTAFDEYLMIDYYTPTGLNKKDSEKAFETKIGVNDSGIRIWHIDKVMYESYYDKEKSVTYFDPSVVEEVKTETSATGEISLPTDLDTTTADVIDFYSSFTTNYSKYYTMSNTTEDANFYVKPEIQLERASEGTTAYSPDDVMTSVDLFKAGSTFGTDDDYFKDYKFYSTKENVPDDDDAGKNYITYEKLGLPYSIKVVSIGDTAKLQLTKIA